MSNRERWHWTLGLLAAFLLGMLYATYAPKHDPDRGPDYDGIYRPY